MISAPSFSFFSLRVVVLALGLTFLAVLSPDALAEDVTKLDVRIRQSGDYLDLLQANRAKAIPARVLAKAEAIVIMRQYKVGFVIGAKGGSGVALVRNKKTRRWSPPAFVNAGEGSVGWQIGGEKSDSVILFMDQKGMEALNGGAFKLGVDVSAAAGPVAGGGQANFDNIREPVLVYANTKGLYAGASIQGGGAAPDGKANMAYYGMNMKGVHLSGKAKLTPSGQNLINKIEAYSKRKTVVRPAQPVRTVPTTKAPTAQ
ncbi:MAG: lipid-binding SYLF domain-containing protein [Verrucomicrobiales bacterium]